LKNIYNKHHPEKQIIASDTKPKEIWNGLHKTIPLCDQESCWLNEIKNKEVKDKMKAELFAPEHPDSWDTNNNEWLSDSDILNVLKQFEKAYPTFEFIGPSPIDFDTRINSNCICKKLCNFSLLEIIARGKKDIGIIFNLDKHSGPGTHWVSLFIKIEDNKLIMLYFDSTGEQIPIEIKTLTNRIIVQFNSNSNNKNSKIIFVENKIEHQLENTECGMYSLVMIITMLTKINPNTQKNNTTTQLIQYLTKGNRIPDNFAEKYRKIYFN